MLMAIAALFLNAHPAAADDHPGLAFLQAVNNELSAAGANYRLDGIDGFTIGAGRDFRLLLDAKVDYSEGTGLGSLLRRGAVFSPGGRRG
jgi:hypothetical protein